MTSGNRPLSDLVLVETVSADSPQALSDAAGMCGRIAADLGAQVLRVETAGAGRSPTALFLHSGKRRFTVSPSHALTLVSDLVRRADAAILDHATHSALAGQMRGAVQIVIAMSCDAPQRGSEFTIEARSGLLDLVGDPAREPLRLGGHQLAYSGGLAAYLAMISALSRRKAGLPTGPVRVDLLDIGVWLNWKTLSIASRTGKTPSRPGSEAEWTIVACADGHVALVYRVQEWPSLMRATGDTRLADARFQTPAGRKRHRAALNLILADIFARMTRAEIRAMALSAKLPLGPVWTQDELKNDPHMIARAFFREAEIDHQRVAIPSLPVRWNKEAFAPVIAEPPADHAMDLAR